MLFDLEILLKHFDLGNLTAQPQRVTGGYLHKMFRLETTTGKYAVKLLNPLIMKRPGVLENYKRAERLERILSENKVPIVPALEMNGARLQCLDEQYFYIFEWTDAKALDWHEIKEEHCQMVGKLLARIHKIPLQSFRFGKTSPSDAGMGQRMPFGYDISGRKFHMDWDQYILQAEKTWSELAEELAENRNLLYHAQQEYNASIESVPDIVCITDGDMDCKNVLWKDGKPLVIDLECLDFGNPFLEMFQLALSWAGGAVCDIDFDRLNGFLRAYRTEYGEITVDWKKLSGVGFAWLDWLEYNTKRALLIECGDEEEQKLGIREAHATIRRVLYYHSVRDSIVEDCNNV